ncbi:3192_t:CDS:2 [Paraglomus occultum]|uniref:3192_t:CDS:1 n=1 Tax=Paraglomus occultum TaxID=144539 RepID=A0A9N8ZU49_9GLOM|nr:3192_t:CDS:2 [Paraglomus occultum]
MSALTDVREHRTHTEEGNLVRKPTITINRSRSLPAESTETPLAHISPTKYLSIDDKNEIKILSIFSAFKEGKLPSNEQIKRFLNKVLNIMRKEKKKQRLSGEGRELMEEFKGLVRVTMDVISRKNADEDFQELVWCLTEAAKKNVGTTSEGGASVDANVMQEARKGVDSLWTITQLLTTNNEFRQLLRDLVIIIRDMFADLTSTIRPPEHEVKRAYNETDRHKDIGRRDQSDIRSSGYSSTVGRKDESMGYSSSTSPTHEDEYGNREESDYENDPRSPEGQRPAYVAEAHEFEATGDCNNQKAKPLDKLKQRLPEKHRHRVDKGAAIVSDKLSGDRRSALIRRLFKVITTVQRHDQYQQAVEDVFDILATWGERASTYKEDIASKKDAVEEDPDWVAARAHLKRLAQSLAAKSLDPLEQAFSDLMKEVREDADLRGYFEEINVYVKSLLKEPGYIEKQESVDRGRELMDRGQFLNDRHRNTIQRVIDELVNYTEALANDPLMHELGERVSRVFSLLLLDRHGRIVFKPHIIIDFRTTFIPLILNNVNNIPIPRIEFTDNDFDVVVENLVLNSPSSFVPNLIELEASNRNFLSLHNADEVRDKREHTCMFNVKGIHAEASKVCFYYKKKTGFPHIKDYGLVDVSIRNRGISITGKLVFANDDKEHVYRVEEVKCTVNDLYVDIKGKRHDFLYFAFHPVLVRLMKQQIARNIEDAVSRRLQSIDQSMKGTFQSLRNKTLDNDKLGRKRSSWLGGMLKRHSSYGTRSSASADSDASEEETNVSSGAGQTYEGHHDYNKVDETRSGEKGKWRDTSFNLV